MTEGLIHLYYGQGKGKTTAAMGLALRALGQGLRVTVVQFLKPGTSGELAPLRRAGAYVLSGTSGVKFTFQMNQREKQEARLLHDQLLEEGAASDCDLLILDEVCAAVNAGLLNEGRLKQCVLERPQGREIVLTGRKPTPWMLETADYITEMVCHRHPYTRGIGARKGVEY